MQFLETIRFENSEFKNLKFHQNRVNQTLEKFYKNSSINLQFELDNFLSFSQKIDKTKNYRIRIIYNHLIEKIEFFEIKSREFKTLKLIFDDKINYSFKYKNRDIFNNYLSKKEEYFDEVLFVKNGFITDTTISNVAFFDCFKQIWVTPKTYLLNGTTRQKLLKIKKISETEIKFEDLKNKKYTKMAMLNAVLGFYEIKNPVEKIFLNNY